MKTSPKFEEIVAICMLVSMRGVIPSLLEYQYQIKHRVEGLFEELKKKSYSSDALDALCRLICLVVDLNTRHCLEEQGIRWYGYELEHVFYGFGSEQLFTERHAKLLFTCESDELADYTRLLFTLSPMPLPGSKLNLPRASIVPEEEDASFIALEEAGTGETCAAEEQKEAVKPLRAFFRPAFFIQLFAAVALLACLWAGCWFYLKDGM